MSMTWISERRPCSSRKHALALDALLGADQREQAEAGKQQRVDRGLDALHGFCGAASAKRSNGRIVPTKMNRAAPAITAAAVSDAQPPDRPFELVARFARGRATATPVRRRPCAGRLRGSAPRSRSCSRSAVSMICAGIERPVVRLALAAALRHGSGRRVGARPYRFGPGSPFTKESTMNTMKPMTSVTSAQAAGLPKSCRRLPVSAKFAQAETSTAARRPAPSLAPRRSPAAPA